MLSDRFYFYRVTWHQESVNRGSGRPTLTLNPWYFVAYDSFFHREWKSTPVYKKADAGRLKSDKMLL